MGCQSEVQLGNNLTFSICTHDPDTGVLTDADAVPTYRVYEDETGTAILSGVMAKLDDANTTGFYSEQIACTTANGFERSKTYSVYISAIVDGDTGGICYGFLVEEPGYTVWNYSARTLTQSAASVVAVVAGTSVTVTRGDTWVISITGLGALTSRTKLWFTAKRATGDADAEAILQLEETAGLVYANGAAPSDPTKGTLAVTDVAAGDITVTVDETVTDDAEIRSGMFYDIQVLIAGVVSTLSSGTFAVSGDVTRAVA